MFMLCPGYFIRRMSESYYAIIHREAEENKQSWEGGGSSHLMPLHRFAWGRRAAVWLEEEESSSCGASWW